jgi:predicted DNA-binding protein (MmcQ/YjbR family)
MDIEWVREYCLSLPHATEKVQWGDDLLFCIGGKMFAVAPLNEAAPVRLSFKCTPEEFAELIEIEGINPAAYVARYHWVSMEQLGALKRSEVKERIRRSYDLVLEKLPKKVRAALG